MPTITPLPSPPSTSDPSSFSAKADAHILALQTFTTEINTFGADLADAGIITPERDSIVATITGTDLWNNSKIQDWTGTPTITDFPDAPSAGTQRIAYPATGTIITNNANISVQGNANYTVAAGDELTITAITTSTFYVTIKRKDGAAIVVNIPSATETVEGKARLATSAENAAGTLEGVIVDPKGIREAFNAAGSAPVYACRAWVNFNGTGTVYIRGSGNIASITDNAIGDYTLNFSTEMPDATYAVMMASKGQDNTTITSSNNPRPTAYSSATTTSVRIYASSMAPALADAELISITIFR